MKKGRFRIISYSKCDASYYETRVKTWFGWVSFTVFYKTDIVHLISDPSIHKALAYDRIYQYCDLKGYEMQDIEIAEISKEVSRKWIFLRRFCCDNVLWVFFTAIFFGNLHAN